MCLFLGITSILEQAQFHENIAYVKTKPGIFSSMGESDYSDNVDCKGNSFLFSDILVFSRIECAKSFIFFPEAVH